MFQRAPPTEGRREGGWRNVLIVSLREIVGECEKEKEGENRMAQKRGNVMGGQGKNGRMGTRGNKR